MATPNDRGSDAASQQPEGKELGRVTKEDIAKSVQKGKVKAVLFVPEGSSIESELDIHVVSIANSSLAAIVARRC